MGAETWDSRSAGPGFCVPGGGFGIFAFLELIHRYCRASHPTLFDTYAVFRPEFKQKNGFLTAFPNSFSRPAGF
jgi:hypothetical protein